MFDPLRERIEVEVRVKAPYLYLLEYRLAIGFRAESQKQKNPFKTLRGPRFPAIIEVCS